MAADDVKAMITEFNTKVQVAEKPLQLGKLFS